MIDDMSTTINNCLSSFHFNIEHSQILVVETNLYFYKTAKSNIFGFSLLIGTRHLNNNHIYLYVVVLLLLLFII